MFHKIANVKALPGALLWVEFRDGTERIYDLQRAAAQYAPFQEVLANREIREAVQVDAGGYGVSWNDNLDLAAEELWANGALLKAPADLVRGDSCPVCGQKIRRPSSAQVAASRANLAKRTHKGGRPINPNSQRQKRLAQIASIK